MHGSHLDAAARICGTDVRHQSLVIAVNLDLEPFFNQESSVGGCSMSSHAVRARQEARDQRQQEIREAREQINHERTNGDVILVQDNTKFHGTEARVLNKCSDGLLVVMVSTGDQYVLLPDEWAKIPIVTAEPRFTANQVESMVREVRSQLPTPISICPQCKKKDTLDRSTLIFSCCGMQFTYFLANDMYHSRFP